MPRRKEGQLTPYQREILGYIAAESARTGACCVSKNVIAKVVGCSEKTVDRAVRCLRAEGFLVVEPCYGESGEQAANSYRIPERPVAKAV